MKKLVITGLALLFLAGGVVFSLPGKVLLVVADKYRNEEFQASIEAVKEAGFIPVVASNYLGVLHGMLGGEIRSETTLKKVNPAEFRAVIFVGGVGAQVFWDNSLAHEIAREFYREGKLVAAICIAPVILAKAGLLKGVEATCWRGVADKLVELGAIYRDFPVVKSGRIITASGPQAASLFKEVLKSELLKLR